MKALWRKTPNYLERPQFWIEPPRIALTSKLWQAFIHLQEAGQGVCGETHREPSSCLLFSIVRSHYWNSVWISLRWWQVSVLAAILSGFGGSGSLSTALRRLGWACEGGKGLQKHLETIRDPEDLHGNLRLFSNPLINLCVAFVQPATCSPMWRSGSRLSANRAQNWIPLKSRLMRCPRRSPSLISCARRMRWTWSDYSSNCKAVSAWRSVSIAQS